MSPFAVFFKTIRLRSRLRQHELASLMGYEQAYVSSVELGVKPASETFMRKLAEVLNFSEEDVDAMHEAAAQSVRRRVLPHDVSTEAYLLCHELWKKIDRLYPAQIRMIRDAIKMDEEMAREPNSGPTRLRRQRKEVIEM